VSRPRFLVVAVDEPEWSLQALLPRMATELGHPLAEQLEVVVDRALAAPWAGRLDGFDAVLFQAQDPLGPLYPRVYGYAQALERACDAAGVPLLGRPEPFSRTCKSRQLQLLRRAGLTAPRAVRLSHWRDALAGDRIAFPLVLRYDCGHSSGDEGFAGPFHSPDELLAARLPERDAWPPRRGLAGLAAVEYVEAAKVEGFYRKYKSFVFGDRVVPGLFSVVRDWYRHHTLETEKARYRGEVERFLHAEPDPRERELCLAAARATDLEIAAVDYSYLPSDGLVVWESNPYPSFDGWWAEDPLFRRRLVEGVSELLEGAARARKT
jgi:hypothetical protein